MSKANLMKSLLKEAELYRNQGLLEQSRASYLKFLKIAERIPPSEKKHKLIRAVRGRLKEVEKEIHLVNDEIDQPQLSDDIQNLIKKLFSFSRTKESAVIEGAIALAKFGQYEQALEEFGKLLHNRRSALVAAKNILRCHLSLASPQAAVDQLVRWQNSHSPLTRKDLEILRSFLSNLFGSMDIEASIPPVSGLEEEEGLAPSVQTQENFIDPGTGWEGSPESEKKEREKEGIEPHVDGEFLDIASLGSAPEAANIDENGSLDDILDISSLKIEVKGKPPGENHVELPVSFQVGNVVSVVLPASMKDLLLEFPEGKVLQDMEIHSPVTVFKGSGKVLGVTDIRGGAHEGGHTLDIIVYAA
ncbi:MAG: hypothetical protein JRJ78_06580 [Deltaproteobacteria bacterium]|nr:hypothetical protein [Deltaproteobacteria bacterium]